MTAQESVNVTARIKAGIAPQYGRCHTALVDGYAIEGHVPVREIQRLLTERPVASGLAVPGMVTMMRFVSSALFAMLAGSSSLALACNDHAPGTEPAPKPVARAASLAAGEVREVDLEDGTITLAHARSQAFGWRQ